MMRKQFSFIIDQLSNVFYEIKQDPGIDIKIQKQMTSNIYKIMIEGIKNINQMIRINHFLRCFLCR